MQICKTCGGDCTRHGNYYVCRFCGVRWEVELTENVGAVKLANAWEALRQNDFDKATELFENIIAETPDSHEAYWGRALARNCIVFVNDLNENKKVPTCNNITENSFLQDADVQKAQKLAPPDIAAGYRDMAQKIENIRVEWLEKARKEPPYDVFICFKDSDRENGIERTQDSYDAQELYTALVEKGYKVFFSRVSLRGKISEQYEPYIYNAIKTAAVMVVFGEKPEYFNAVWLKNEWGRFKTLIEKKEKHKNALVVVYKNMDPGQLPVVLKSRQCLNAAGITFLTDLENHIKKVIEVSRGTAQLERIKLEGGQIAKKATSLTTQTIETHEVGQGAVAETDIDEQKKLELIGDYVEAQKWAEAEQLVDELLFDNPSYAEAIWTKLLIAHRAATGEALLKTPLGKEDLDTIEKCLNCAPAAFAGRILRLLYQKGPRSASYEAILKVVLPFRFDERDKLIAAAFDEAIANGRAQIFEILLGTLQSDEVDRYVQYNFAYLEHTEKQAEKRACLSRILAVDAGNVRALRYRLQFDLSADVYAAVLQTEFEEILKYLPVGDGQVAKEVGDTLALLTAHLTTVPHCTFAKQLLRYYPSDIKELAEPLQLLAARILWARLFDEAEYFLKLLLSFDPNSAQIYWMICLLRVRAASAKDVPNSKIPLGGVPEFKKYLTLVDKARRQQCIALCDAQKQAKQPPKEVPHAPITIRECPRCRESIVPERTVCPNCGCDWQTYCDEQEKIARKKAQTAKTRKITAITAACMAVAVLLIVLTVTVFVPTAKYNKAEQLLAAGDYEAAAAIYNDLNGYKQSDAHLSVIDATDKLEKGDYEGAIREMLAAGVPVTVHYQTAGGEIAKTDTVTALSDMELGLLSAETGGTDTVTVNFDASHPFSALATPTRGGYRFSGWKMADNQYNIKSGIFRLTLKATWGANIYNITYDLAGGRFGSETIKRQFSPEDGTFTLPHPTRTGYTFAGWQSTDMTAPKIDLPIAHGSWGDRTYTATWQANTYTVTFNANGGNDVAPQTVTYDAGYQLPTPTRTGYTFVGWYEGTTKIENGTWQTTGGKSLTAHWQIITYTVAYVLGGGTNAAVNPATFNIENNTITLAAPSRTGYTFTGWTWPEQSTPQMTATIPAGTHENRTFTANWQIITYTVTYYLEDGDNAVGNPTVITVENGTITLSAPTKTGYTFTGWTWAGQTTPQLTATIPAGTHENKTFTAHWQINIYTISYVLGGGMNDGANPATFTIESNAITLAAPQRTGYTFTGWTWPEQSTPQLSVTIQNGTHENKAFTANWQANTYTVTFDASGGNAVAAQTVTYDAAYTLPTPTGSPVGYVFAGWYDGTTRVTNGTWYIADNKTLTAHWTAVPYTIAYTLNGGTNAQSNPATLTIESDSLTLAAPSRTGYTFTGWTWPGQEEPQLSVTIPAGTHENKAFTANWQANTYTVTFDANEGIVSPATQQVTYDAAYALPTPERTGYTFAGWYNGAVLYPNSGTWQTADHTTLTAHWIARNDIAYTVKHYQQNIEDDDYTWFETQNLTGTADSTVTPATKTYTGFTAPATQTVTVSPDGSLVVNYYYTRNTYTVTFVTNGGEAVDSVTQKYQSAIDYSSIRTDYTFGGWFSDVELTKAVSTMPAQATTVYAWWTEENKPGDFIYDGTTAIAINGYQGTDTTVQIPAYIGGVAVTSLGGAAFANCTALTSVTIPDHVTSIGSAVFSGCSSLESMTIPFVGNRAGVTAGSTYQYPLGYLFGTDSYTGGNKTYQPYYGSSTSSTTSAYYCIPATLRSVTVTGGYIASNAFFGLTDLTTIILHHNVTSIGDRAFQYCSDLTSITIPDSVTSIGQYAFNGCTGLTSVTIRHGVVSIDQYAFYNCTDLTGITIPESTKTIGVSAFSGCTSLPNLVIPDSVTSIGSTLVSGCTSLTSITIGNGVTSIPEYALKGCPALENITIPFVGISRVTSDSKYQYPLGIIFGSSSYTGGVATTQYYYYGQNTGSTTNNSTYYIPATLRSVTVTGGHIPYGAFYNCAGLTTVTLGDGITSTGSTVFNGCTSLTSVIIGNGLTTICNSLFSGLASLTSVTIGNGVTSIGSSAFYNCTNLTNITVPDSVTSIGGGAFSGCTNLTNITVPDSVTSIGSSAFYNCTGLTSVAIGNSVTSIGNDAFAGCVGLTSVTIPDSVTRISQSAFYNCTGLTAVYITDIAKWCGISFGIGGANPLCNAHNLYVNGELAAELVIPDGVTRIGQYAFSSCTALTSITIPDSVTSIGEHAFWGCTGLTNITIPDSVTSIGDAVFIECTGLTSITIPDSVTSIGSYAFSGCTGLTNITIGNGVTNIGLHAFVNCTNLTSITIESANNYGIPTGAFKGCSSLAHISARLSGPLGSIFGTGSYEGGVAVSQYNGNSYTTYYVPATLRSVTVTGGSVSAYAFDNCTNLTGITLAEGVTDIGTYAFRNCTGLSSVTVENGVTAIGEYAFYWCTGLTSVIIPDSVTSIGKSAFIGCTGLTSVTIENGVTSIGNSAFSGCTGLTSITLPFVGQNRSGGAAYFGYIFGASSYNANNSSVPASLKTVAITDCTAIGGNAFYGCTGLTSVTIGNGVTSIGGYAFSGCTGLTSITIPSGVTSIGSYAFSGCTGLTNITIPSGAISIGSYAFQNCTGLTNIVLPDGVTNIDGYAFSGCTALKNVVVPDSITSFATTAFSGCTNLIYNLYNNAKYLGNGNNPYLILVSAAATDITSCQIHTDTAMIVSEAFRNCTSLAGITIPANVTMMGGSVFRGCTGLTGVTIGNGVTSIGAYAFQNCTGLLTVTIGNGVTSIGSYAFQNCTGLLTVIIGNGLTTIGQYAFDGCSELTSITLASDITNIGSQAFQYCTSLTAFIMPESLTTIGALTFYGCTSLTNIVIPDSVTSIGSYAFSGCTGLTNVAVGNGVVATTSTGAWLGMFSGCSSLESITIRLAVPLGYIFGAGSFAGGVATQQHTGSGSALSTYYVPATLQSVTILGESVPTYALENCINVTSVILDENITSIGSYAFSGCTELTSIIMPDGLISIGGSAFNNCTNLVNVIIPDNVTDIYSYAFSACSGLTDITIPESVTCIRYGTFFDCTNLESITILGDVTIIEGSSFQGCTALTDITFAGTTAEWNAINKGDYWNYNTGNYTIQCTDGDIT